MTDKELLPRRDFLRNAVMLAGAGIPVRMMRAEKETLEEVFLRETDKNNE